jgi:hypothetical protein
MSAFANPLRRRRSKATLVAREDHVPFFMPNRYSYDVPMVLIDHGE